MHPSIFGGCVLEKEVGGGFFFFAEHLDEFEYAKITPELSLEWEPNKNGEFGVL